MTSEPIRDPASDALLTPKNSALVVIDYQPSQVQAVHSMDHELLLRNIVSVARLAKAYQLPVVLSTVNVNANGQRPTLPELKEVLADSVELDRTQINAWEDVEFRAAVEATGGRSADQLGVARVRTSARPGTYGHCRRRRRHRAHIATAQGLVSNTRQLTPISGCPRDARRPPPAPAPLSSRWQD